MVENELTRESPVPHDESERLKRLHDLNIMDTPPELEFDSLVQAAAIVCDVPISLISLLDADRQWFKANVGLPNVKSTPRDISFCTHSIKQAGIMEVQDARADRNYAKNPLVTGAPGIRFYAGVTLELRDGTRIGTLCVIDRKPGLLTPKQRQVLKHLAKAAVRAIELRSLTLKYVGSEARFRALCDLAPLGVFATDTKGACTYTNERWQSTYGMSLSDSLSQSWVSTLHPDDKPAVLKEWKRTSDLHLPFDMQFRILHKDGTLKHVRSVSRPVADDQGEVHSHVGSVEDITQRVFEQDELETVRNRLALATESGRIGVWELNIRTKDLHWDPLMFQLYGVSPSPGPHDYQLWANMVHPEDLKETEQRLLQSITDGRSFESEFRVTTPNGSIRHIRAAGRLTHDDNNEPLTIVGVNWDVTHLHKLAAELAQQHELLSVTLQSIGDAVITTDAAGRVSWLNPVAERMTGWTSEEAMSLPLSEVFRTVNEESREATPDPAELCMRDGEIIKLDERTVLISRHGQERGVEQSAAPIRNSDREILGTVIVFHDVTEQRKLSGEMSYRAKHDPLTGLVNRGEFEARLARVLSNAQAQATLHALLYIDLDRFKLINDACGHSAGDQALRQITKLIANLIRSRDTLARLGGDEFAVILEHCPRREATRVAQEICDLVDKYRFLHEGGSFRLGTSIGLVPIHRKWTATAAIMQAADSACYAAKEGGGNRVHPWRESDAGVMERQGEMRWAIRLEEAIDADRFQLYGQQIQSLKPGHPGAHIELLLRMNGDDDKLVMPAAFLPAAERFHLASRIDRWVLQQAIQQLKSTNNRSKINTLLINISGRSVEDRAFHRDAIRALIRSGKDTCKQLCLEITETAAITNMADAASFIDRVRKLGVRIALDDFGSGASSFGYLKTLKVDLLKIDGQFIRNLTDDPLDDVTVRSFANVAQVMGVKIVAEHVERQEVLERIRDLGIDFAQGYLIHKPEPIEGLLSRIAAIS